MGGREDNNYSCFTVEHDGPTSFVNCINLTIKEFHDLALFRGIAGGGCCLLCVLTLVLIIIHRAFKTILQRLFLYLTISTIAYCGVLTLHVEHYFHPYEGQKVFCIAIGFLDQYTGSVQLLFTFGITAFLFYKVCELCSSCVPIARLGGGGEEWRECRMVAEISWVLFSFVIPLAFNWLPFIFTPYGETGPWCWIDSVRDDCSASESGYWEQMLLWYIPLATVAFCSLLLLLIMMGVFIWICKDAQRARQRIESGVIKQSLLLLAFLVFFCALCAIEVSIRTITHRSNDYSNYGVWIIYALSTPVSAAIIPIAFFFYLYSSKMLWVIKRAAVKLGLRQSTIQVQYTLPCTYLVCTSVVILLSNCMLL